jgi:hypothetical protein
MSNWSEHNIDGKTVAKCVVCGWNSGAYNIGTDRECNNCLDAIEDAQLAEKKAAMYDAMNDNTSTIDVTEWINFKASAVAR